ncbi:hypothetical protein RV15_GL003516 [Enterococcus silesiacus]|uniref:Uncharacterized protein n=1 Tax=Enterococcus silesiacus TaxID=332949 RepID=A0AA91JPW3_9ENTE|nr:hypothetical protein RV15_GL003516 [Enterococcus silesiacus]
MENKQSFEKLLFVVISGLIPVIIDKFWEYQIKLSTLFILALVILLVVYFFLYQSKN